METDVVKSSAFEYLQLMKLIQLKNGKFIYLLIIYLFIYFIVIDVCIYLFVYLFIICLFI